MRTRSRHSPGTPVSPSAPVRAAALAVAAAVALGTPVRAQAPAEPVRGWQRVSIPETGTYSDRYIPSGLELAEPVPVIVFLHGSGAEPNDWRPLLAPHADDLGTVFVVPKSISTLGFGPGADRRTVESALRRLSDEIVLDPQRTSVAGHSSGGAFAYVLAYASVSRFAGVFALGSPYRTVLAAADPDYTAPARLYYGTEDPNFSGGSRQALVEQTDRLGAALEEEIRVGFGHSDWPATTLPDGFRFLLDQRYRTPGGCLPSATRLCLDGGRFAVEATWETPGGDTGVARAAAARTADSGLLWFFEADNWEVTVKVLDGCPVNGFWWVFASASTDVGFELTVTDLGGGGGALYVNPVGTVAETITDTRAFPCP